MSYNFTSLSNLLIANIQQISTNVNTLQKLVQQLGCELDTIEFRRQLQTLQHQTNDLAKQCNSNLQELTRLGVSTDATQNRNNKLMCEKIRSDFLIILNKFQEIQRIAAQKVKEFTPKQPKHDINTNQDKNYGNDDFNFESTTLSFKDEHPMGQTQTQSQLQMTDLQEKRDRLAIAEQQNETFRRLEADIVDVNQIFTDLARMVHDQGDIITTIEGSIDDTHINIVNGNQQLQIAADYAMKARKKRLWIVVILVVILIILTIIIYFSVNH